MRFLKGLKSVVGARSGSDEIATEEVVYAIADIHGRQDLFKRALKLIDADREATGDRGRIVLMGDLIDRGEESRAVVDIALRLRDTEGGSLIVLMGNHEASLLDFLDNPVSGAGWFAWGGAQTLASYGVRPPSMAPGADELRELREAFVEALGQTHAQFYRQGLTRLWKSGNVVFAHAGIDASRALVDQDDKAILWGQHGQEGPTQPPGMFVVRGHEVVEQPELRADRLISIDTGAYYTGMLTIARLSQGAPVFLST